MAAQRVTRGVEVIHARQSGAEHLDRRSSSGGAVSSAAYSGAVIDVVGISAAGWEALGPGERALLEGARVIVGGERHLALLPEHVAAERRTWPRPLREGLPDLLASLGQPADADSRSGAGVVALASGDPLRSGIASTLIDLLGADQVRVHPSLASDTLARARMGWSAERVEVITTVGRDLRRVLPSLAPGARLVVLLSDGSGPAELAALLTDRGWGASRVTAWWHLGGDDEGSARSRAEAWELPRTPDLVLCCVEAAPDGDDAAALGPVPGRPEATFASDGQITKRDVRASALAHLRPADGGHLWDLGAGSGAVGIEWCLAAPRTRCTSIERDPGRAARIRATADELGVGARLTVLTADLADGLDVVLGDGDDAAPDAVFVGGGLTEELADEAWTRLPVGGRFVAHAVTLQTEAVLVALHRRTGGALTRLSVEHARPLGRYLSWTPARPVVQLAAVRTRPGTTEGEA